MPKDYAKNNARKKQRYPELILIVFFLLVASGGGIYWLHNHKDTLFSWGANLFKHSHPTVSTAKPPVVAATTEDNAVHFDFYTELPNMQIAQPLTPQPPSPEAEEKYILQLGMFKDSLGASQLRVSLLLAGIDVDIVKIKTGYRVQQGPYANARLAKTTQQQLEKRGIESTVKKL